MVRLPGLVCDSASPVTRSVTVVMDAACGVPAAVVTTSVWVCAAVSVLICCVSSVWSGPPLLPGRLGTRGPGQQLPGDLAEAVVAVGGHRAGLGGHVALGVGGSDRGRDGLDRLAVAAERVGGDAGGPVLAGYRLGQRQPVAAVAGGGRRPGRVGGRGLQALVVVGRGGRHRAGGPELGIPVGHGERGRLGVVGRQAGHRGHRAGRSRPAPGSAPGPGPGDGRRPVWETSRCRLL